MHVKREGACDADDGKNEKSGSVEIPFKKKEAPLAPVLTPFGWGRRGFLNITGDPYPGNTTQSQPGHHSGGAKPQERYQKKGFLQSQKLREHINILYCFRRGF